MGGPDKDRAQRQEMGGEGAMREEERREHAAQWACREGTVKKAMPQWQRIAGNAAVVEEERKDNAAQKACREGAAEKRGAATAVNRGKCCHCGIVKGIENH